jgi:transcriptional regulator with XRE-family HTH domain
MCVKHTARLPSANVIGAAVRRLRIEAGLTQIDLIGRLEVLGLRLDRTALSRIESGSRFVLDYEVAALAHVLATEPSYLYPKIDWKKAHDQRTGEE